MQLISALSLQMPWLSLTEFNLLTEAIGSGVEWRELQYLADLTSHSRQFLDSQWNQAFKDAERLVSMCEDSQIEIIYPGHLLYPKGAFELENPPLFLSLEGHWPLLTSIAIVGSREPSRYAVDWLNENMPEVFATNKCLVISGGARGIDLAAHLTAIRNGEATLAFLPSGLRNLYPKDLQRYKTLILESGGGLVSEYAPNDEMRKFHFLKRNRLIVASSDVVFVVEARRKSGSMLTAGIANAMNKTVCTLPTSPAMTCAQGSLDLIFNGAFPIRDSLDLASLLGLNSRRA